MDGKAPSEAPASERQKMAGEPLLEELTEEPTADADIKIFVSRSGLGITSKGAPATLLVTTALALVALPILLLRLLVDHDIPMSVFFYADGLGTIAVLSVAAMTMTGNKNKRLSDPVKRAPGPP
jgi:hypothetical protein